MTPAELREDIKRQLREAIDQVSDKEPGVAFLFGFIRAAGELARLDGSTDIRAQDVHVAAVELAVELGLNYTPSSYPDETGE